MPESTRSGTTGYAGEIGDPFSTVRLFGTVQHRAGNLPIQTTPLVDREKEFEALRELIHRDNVRLITLTGPGGSGKTRLALELALNLKDEFLDGVFFVPLAAVTEANLVPSRIVTTLEMMEKAGEPIEYTLKQFLRDKQTLLLLDNFEHVILAASFAAELLHRCPRLKIIVTSREPLRVQGEYEFPVLPLAVPDLSQTSAAGEIMLYAAVALFVQRAQAIKADFCVTGQNARTVAEICSRVDGLPLALELAAARTRVLSLEGLLQRLQKRLEILTAGPRDLPGRQHTLRNTIAWSYDLLDEQNKILFRRLSVFAADFSFEAAEEICSNREDSAETMLDQLSRLVEKSLLLTEQTDNEIRFRMLETIREFAHEVLATSGESSHIQERFASYFLSLAQEAGSELMGPEQATMLIRLDREHDNLRAALRWSIENGDVERSLGLGSALWNFWHIRGHLSEGRMWLTKIIEKAGSTRTVTRARALMGAGALAKWQNDFPSASSLLKESLALSRELGDLEGTAFALNYMANVADDLGYFTEGRRLYEESLGIFRQLGHKWGEALVLNNLGVGARNQGDYDAATKLHKRSLELFTELHDKRRIAHSLINLGFVLERRREYDAASKTLSQSLSLFRELGGRVGIAECCFLSGSVARRKGDFETSRKLLAESLVTAHEIGYQEVIAGCFEESAASDRIEGNVKRAARLLAAAENIRKVNRIPIPPAYQTDYHRDLAFLKSTLGKEFQTEWAKGRAMTLEQVVADVLSPKASNV
jgi:predicted ATPase